MNIGLEHVLWNWLKIQFDQRIFLGFIKDFIIGWVESQNEFYNHNHWNEDEAITLTRAGKDKKKNMFFF